MSLGIAFLNAGGLGPKIGGLRDYLASACPAVKLVGVVETKHRTGSVFNMEGWQFVGKGGVYNYNSKHVNYGLGVYIRDDLFNSCLCVEVDNLSSSRHVLWLRVTQPATDLDLFICVAYCPRDSVESHAAARETVWKDIESSAAFLHREGHNVIIIGDLNARFPIGHCLNSAQRPDMKEADGEHWAVLNAGSLQRLIERQPWLTSMNTAGLATRVGSNNKGVQRSQLDYMLLDSSLLPSVSEPLRIIGTVDQNSGQLTNGLLGSDHCLLTLGLEVSIRDNPRLQRVGSWRLRMSALADPTVREKLRTALADRLPFWALESTLEWQTSTDRQDAVRIAWESFTSTFAYVTESSVNAFWNHPKRDVTMSRQSADLTRKRREQLALARKRSNAWVQETRREIRREKRHSRYDDKERWKTDIAHDNQSKAETATRLITSDPAAAAKIIKQLSREALPSTVSSAPNSAAKEHYQQVTKDDPMMDVNFSADNKSSVVSELVKLESIASSSPDPEPNEKEIANALSTIKRRKAPGLDGVLNDVLKLGGSEVVKALRLLFSMVWRAEFFPDSALTAVIVPLFKGKGDPSDPANSRPISLTSAVMKVLETVINARLARSLETAGVFAEEQSGFRARRRVEDNLFILNHVLSSRKASRTFAAFLDIKRAYDTVWRPALWVKLHQAGVTGNTWRIIRAMYRSVSSVVRAEGQLSDPFEAELGVRQGSVLSPLLFNVFINDLVSHLNEAGCGVAVCGRRLACLLFADDIVLLADSEASLQKLLDSAADYATTWRLQFNAQKSAVLCFGDQRTLPGSKSWSLGKLQLQQGSQYQYLGITFCADGSWKLQASNSSHAALHAAELLVNTGLVGAESRRRSTALLVNSFAWSVLYFAAGVIPYGADSYKPATTVSVTHNTIIKRSVGLPKWESNAGSSGELGQISSTAVRLLAILRFVSHVLSLPSDRLLSKVFAEAWGARRAHEWARYLARTAGTYGVDPLSVKSKAGTEAARKKILAKEQETWLDELAASTRLEELHLGGKLALSVYPELDAAQPSTRWIITQLRLGCSSLLDHLRQHRQIEDATCVACNSGSRETTRHFLLYCPALQQTRDKLEATLKALAEKHPNSPATMMPETEGQWLACWLLLRVRSKSCTEVEKLWARCCGDSVEEMWTERCRLVLLRAPDLEDLIR